MGEDQQSIEKLDQIYYEHFNPRVMGLHSAAFMMCQITQQPAARDFALPQKISFGGIQNPQLFSYSELPTKAKPAFEKYLEKVQKLAKERQRQEEDEFMRMG